MNKSIAFFRDGTLTDAEMVAISRRLDEGRKYPLDNSMPMKEVEWTFIAQHAIDSREQELKQELPYKEYIKLLERGKRCVNRASITR